jgi:predicted DNA-binding transcriptional regulator AlpA
MPAEAKPLIFISKRQLLQRVPYSYPTIWKLMRKGQFPRPRVMFGKNAWDAEAVDGFLRSLPQRQYTGNPKSVVEKFTDAKKRLKRGWSK